MMNFGVSLQILSQNLKCHFRFSFENDARLVCPTSLEVLLRRFYSFQIFQEAMACPYSISKPVLVVAPRSLPSLLKRVSSGLYIKS